MYIMKKAEKLYAVVFYTITVGWLYGVRDYVLLLIENQSAYPSGFLCKIQGFAHPVFDVAATVASIFGSEEFYIPLLATSAWIVQLEMALLLGTILAISLLMGNLLKNIFCLPRPRSPPVIVKANEHDWGMPSTHSYTAITIPFYFLICLWRTVDMSNEIFITLCILTILWATTIIFSRMYLGLHSPADILGGVTLGVITLASFIYLEKDILKMYQNPQIIWQGPLFLLLMIYFHPRPYPTTSYYTSTIICGTLNGFILVAQAFYAGLVGTPNWKPIMLANFENPIRNTILRIVIGLGLLLLSKEIAKPIVYAVFSFICDLFGIQYEKYQQKKIEATRSFTHVGVLEKLLNYQSKMKKREALAAKLGKSSMDGSSEMASELSSDELTSLELILKYQSDTAIDLDIPVKFVVYSLLPMVCLETTKLFLLLNI